MKRKIGFKLVLLLLMPLIWACQNQGATENANENNTENTSEGYNTQPPSNVPNICRVEGDSFQIKPECAVQYISAWKDGPFKERSQIGQDSAYIVRGFHLKHGELKDILNSKGDNIDVWAWLSIEDGEAALILEVTELATEEGAGGSSYFDFTTPCPDLCPD